MNAFNAPRAGCPVESREERSVSRSAADLNIRLGRIQHRSSGRPKTSVGQ
jgi:hypothetical protein